MEEPDLDDTLTEEIPPPRDQHTKYRHSTAARPGHYYEDMNDFLYPPSGKGKNSHQVSSGMHLHHSRTHGQLHGATGSTPGMAASKSDKKKAKAMKKMSLKDEGPLIVPVSWGCV